MALARARFVLQRANSINVSDECGRRVVVRNVASKKSGAILPEPKSAPFGFIGVVFGVSIGLFIGAMISKNVANFLEENDLFVPSDDDDDDD